MTVESSLLPMGWGEYFSTAREQDQRVDASKTHGRQMFDRLIATDSRSSVMTVAYCLHRLGLAGQPKLTLWLVGADHEADQPWLELLCWLLPTVREVTIRLIGPHAPATLPS
eukprot:SAG31_NODE_640_length_13322_cov_4.396703_15_plen_112_part_00